MFEEWYRKVDGKVLSLLNDALWFLEKNDKELARESVECARQVVYVAEDLGLITFNVWENINALLQHTYYRLF